MLASAAIAILRPHAQIEGIAKDPKNGQGVAAVARRQLDCFAGATAPSSMLFRQPENDIVATASAQHRIPAGRRPITSAIHEPETASENPKQSDPGHRE
jgi:hypothetical protein